MKKFLLSAVAAMSIGALTFFALDANADRVDTWLASSVTVQTVTLLKLTDGGCAVSALATVTKSDGGVSLEDSAAIEVSGANRTTCLDVLNNKAPVLFKADKGL